MAVTAEIWKKSRENWKCRAEGSMRWQSRTDRLVKRKKASLAEAERETEQYVGGLRVL